MNTAEPPKKSSGPTEEQIMKRSIDLSFGLIVMLLNIAEIIIISRTKKKMKYQLLILSLSVTDMLFGLSNSVVSCIYLSRNAKNEEVLEITYTTYFYFVLNSILHLIWIALDRLWAVCKPFQHRTIMTKKKTYIAIGVMWFASTVTAASLYLADELSEAFMKTEQSITYVNVTINGTDVNLTTTLGTEINLTTTLFPVTTTSFDFVQNKSPALPWSRKSPRPPKPTKPPRRRLVPRLKVTKTNVYHELMTSVLSVFIIIADVTLLFLYIMIVYLIRKTGKIPLKTASDTEDRVSIICLLIAGSFILFTLPYALARFVSGQIPLWANLILVSNSGLNSILYFFRGKCEKWQSKLEKKNQKPPPSSTLSTPVSTPYEIRKGTPSPRLSDHNHITTQL